jgi:RNA polymerase sigma-70 factor (ECF subfamily)
LSKVEQEIIKLFKAGDVRAMDLLYDHYADTLYGIVCKMLGNEEEAQDVLQDAFVKIWKRSSHYDASKGRLFTWLLSIVRNQAIDLIRKKDRRGEIQGAPSDVHIENKPTDQKAEGTDMDVKTVLTQLSAEQKQLVEYSYIYGYSHSEIAKKLDLPLGTVKTKIRSAMQELRLVFGNGR